MQMFMRMNNVVNTAIQTSINSVETICSYGSSVLSLSKARLIGSI